MCVLVQSLYLASYHHALPGLPGEKEGHSTTSQMSAWSWHALNQHAPCTCADNAGSHRLPSHRKNSKPQRVFTHQYTHSKDCEHRVCTCHTIPSQGSQRQGYAHSHHPSTSKILPHSKDPSHHDSTTSSATSTRH